MTTFQDPPLQSRRAARQGERNAAYGQQPEQDAEPLTYSTQNRPRLPQYDGPDFRARRTPETPEGEPERAADDLPQAESSATDQPATQMLPEQHVPSYRPRDYSPEGHRSPVVPLIPDAPSAPVAGSVPASPAPAVGSVPAAPAPAAAQPVEHTMTRRELRALREAQGQQVDAPAPPTSPSSVREQIAPAVPAAADEQQAPVESAPAPELSPFEALFAAPSQTTPTPLVQPLVDAVVAAEPAAEPVHDTVAGAESEPEVAASQPAVPDLVIPELIVPEPPAPAAVPPAASVAPAPSAPARSGHWSTQADLDDASQAAESTISRNIGPGSGAITTSALVLPSLPNPEYARLGTGEILVTGSIDLPHSLATSGAHPAQLDEHHLDHELDPGDHQVVSTDSQPVRAVKAISSHTSTRNVIVAKKPVGNRALTALIISAAGMAAVVVTLLVVGLVSGVL